MSEPRRLIVESSDEIEIALLRSAEMDGSTPPPEVRDQILAAAGAAIASAGATAALSGAGGSAIASAKLGTIVKWIGIAAFFGGVAFVTVRPRMNEQPAIAAAPPPVVAVVDPAARVAPAALAAEPGEPAAAEPVRTAPAARSAPVAAAAASASLYGEIRALDEARGAIKRGDAAAARAALDDYDRRYPGRSLAPEAELLWVRTLLAEGRRAEARARAVRLLSANASTPYAKRIEALFPDLANPNRTAGKPQ